MKKRVFGGCLASQSSVSWRRALASSQVLVTFVCVQIVVLLAPFLARESASSFSRIPQWAGVQPSRLPSCRRELPGPCVQTLRSPGFPLECRLIIDTYEDLGGRSPGPTGIELLILLL